MPHYRRAHDYTIARHILEQVALRIFGSGWAARLHQRLGFHQPLRIWHETITIALPAPTELPPPLRIVFASDFHSGPMTLPSVITAAIQAISALQPDLLLLGGDYVSWNNTGIDTLATQLGQIEARYGRYGVLGNHDLWADDIPIRRAFAKAGIQILLNQEIRLPPPYQQLRIYGMDDPTAGQPQAPHDPLTTGEIRIVLTHAPEGLALLQPEQYQFALAGHTHGGQVALPNGFAFLLLPGSLSQRYAAGRHRITTHQREILVSRGVGYGDLPIRWNAPADILACTLQWERQ
ncbi:MAG: hypothetical protein Fur005_46730 [Roseiflexaceae bacterium]